MARGCFIASVTDCLVMALKTTRSIFWSFSAFFSLSASSTCHEMASPSRSGSVARMRVSAFLSAWAISLTRFCDCGSPSHNILKLSAWSTDPSLAGRSRIWPKEASTSKPGPRYLLIVFALDGDSTTTTFMRIQWVNRRNRVGSGGIGGLLRREHGEGDPCCQIRLCPRIFKNSEFGHEHGGLLQIYNQEMYFIIMLLKRLQLAADRV